MAWGLVNMSQLVRRCTSFGFPASIDAGGRRFVLWFQGGDLRAKLQIYLRAEENLRCLAFNLAMPRIPPASIFLPKSRNAARGRAGWARMTKPPIQEIFLLLAKRMESQLLSGKVEHTSEPIQNAEPSRSEPKACWE